MLITVQQQVYVKQVFLWLLLLITKAHNKLELQDDICCVLSAINPYIEMLTKRKQMQKSH